MKFENLLKNSIPTVSKHAIAVNGPKMSNFRLLHYRCIVAIYNGKRRRKTSSKDSMLGLNSRAASQWLKDQAGLEATCRPIGR